MILIYQLLPFNKKIEKSFGSNINVFFILKESIKGRKIVYVTGRSSHTMLVLQAK